MDRQQFAKIIDDRRKEVKCTYLALTMRTGQDPKILQNVILGRTNVFVDTILHILPHLNMQLHVCKQDVCVVIENTNTLAMWAQNTFNESGMSRSQFATEIGLHRNSMPSHLNGQSKMRIDTFLAWASLTGWEPKLSLI